MLVIGRKLGERTVIEVPPSTTTTVIEHVVCRQERHGWIAPPQVSIRRSELLEDGKPGTKIGERDND